MKSLFYIGFKMKPVKLNLVAKINRLDQALRIWEDKMERLYMQQMLTKKFLPNMEPTYFLSTYASQHWKSLRHTLLHAVSDKGDNVEIKKFADGALFSSEISDGLFGDFVFPEMVFNWSKHSRRIFQVNDELATNLAATSFGDALLGDIKLPFDAFAVSLDTPVSISSSGNKVDFILLARADITTGLLLGGGMSKIPNTEQAISASENTLGKNPYYLMFFQSGMEKYQKHDEKLKARILQKLKDGDDMHLDLLVNSLKGKDAVYYYSAAGCISVADPECGKKSLVPLSELLKDDEMSNLSTGELDNFPDFTKIVRIVYGLAMYLTQSRASDIISVTRPPVSEKSGMGIT
jgi:hypothetical protein